jgi:hypothetical protein
VNAESRFTSGRTLSIDMSLMGAAAEVEKERSAMENDFGVKSIDSPAAQCDCLAAKANQRASLTGEDRD